MSTPFIEIPQRADALPRITTSPPRPVAPADCAGVAVDDDGAGHDVLGARPTPALPCTRTVACLFMPAQ